MCVYAFLSGVHSHRPQKDARCTWIVRELDPRIHFSLNCGSVSCPALEFYTSDNLDEMLTVAAESFVAATTQVDEASGTVTLSKILDWYGGDFGGNKRELIKALVEYAPAAPQASALQRLLDSGNKLSLKFDKYDWSVFVYRPVVTEIAGED